MTNKAIILATIAGVLLSAMITTNSYLSTWSSPLIASWFAHGSGAIVAWLLLLFFRPRTQISSIKKVPYWCYLGGVPGALAVLLASITINGPLKLAASLGLMLTGQLLYGMLSDIFGWFGMSRHGFRPIDLLSIILILSGCLLLIIGR